MVQTCFRVNDYGVIKIFSPKSVREESLVQTSFQGNATIKNSQEKMFNENSWYESVFEEIKCNHTNFPPKIF